MWNTTEGGPCVFRPIAEGCWDAPNPGGVVADICVKGVDCNGKCIINSKKCPEAKCDEYNILTASETKTNDPGPVLTGRFVDADLTKKDERKGWARHSCCWNNEKILPR